MRYPDSMSRSAEHLRAALPLMTRQRTALHPISYAVWYEFVTSRNLPLNQALLAQTRDGATLDEAQTWELYRQHIGDGMKADEIAKAKKIGEGLSKVLDNMAVTAAEAGQETARFDDSLGTWVEQLLAGPSEQTQSEVLRELLSGSREIRAAMTVLQTHLSHSQQEIDSLRKEVQKARGEALVDALTGLPNRRAFDQQLSACMAEQRQLGTGLSTPAGVMAPCLLLGDIDFFKRINDSFGHSFGDQVLRAVARTLQGALSDGALAARVGGEEFAILLPSSSLDQAQGLAENLRSKVAAGRIRRGERVQEAENVTISLGVTQLAAGESAADFYGRADRALYAAKHGGRNRIAALTH